MIKSAWRETRTWRHLAAFAFEVPRRLFEDRLTQSAGSLTYTTLLVHLPKQDVTLAVIAHQSHADLTGILSYRQGSAPSLLDILLAR